MGERIRDLSSFKIGDKKVKIELNNPYSKDHCLYDIHIQSNKMQYYLTNTEFMSVFSALTTAKRRLDSTKSDLGNGGDLS